MTARYTNENMIIATNAETRRKSIKDGLYITDDLFKIRPDVLFLVHVTKITILAYNKDTINFAFR